jgi:hypothetical protein
MHWRLPCGPPDVEVVRFLADKGLDANALSVGARRVAFGRYDLPTVEFLMSKGLGSATDILVTAATWQPHARRSPAGLNRERNVNASNPAQYARTPLLTAVTSEAEGAETLKLLLDRGADPNARTTEGESALRLGESTRRPRKDRAARRTRGQATATAPRQEDIAPPATGGTQRSTRVADEESGENHRRRPTVPRAGHLHFVSITNAMPALAASTARRRVSRSTKHGRARTSTTS